MTNFYNKVVSPRFLTKVANHAHPPTQHRSLHISRVHVRVFPAQVLDSVGNVVGDADSGALSRLLSGCEFTHEADLRQLPPPLALTGDLLQAPTAGHDPLPPLLRSKVHGATLKLDLTEALVLFTGLPDPVPGSMIAFATACFRLALLLLESGSYHPAIVPCPNGTSACVAAPCAAAAAHALVAFRPSHVPCGVQASAGVSQG